MGKVGSSDTRQARLFLRSRGGGRLDASAKAVDGLNSSRQGDMRDPKDSSLEVGEDGLESRKISRIS
jgi:hypothetical protein